MTSRQSIQLNEQKATSLAEAAVAKPSKRQDKAASTEARALCWPKKSFKGLMRRVDAGILSRFGRRVS